jgi:hypothetical protein
MDVRKPGRVWTDLGVQNTYVVAVASMAHRVAKVASGDQVGLDGSVMDNGWNMHVYIESSPSVSFRRLSNGTSKQPILFYIPTNQKRVMIFSLLTFAIS